MYCAIIPRRKSGNPFTSQQPSDSHTLGNGGGGEGGCLSYIPTLARKTEQGERVERGDCRGMLCLGREGRNERGERGIEHTGKQCKGVGRKRKQHRKGENG